MKRHIRIGFSMHPRWAGSAGLTKFISPFQEIGLSVLEFELDDSLDCWNESLALMDEAVQEGLGLSFHAPYRASRSLVGFSDDRQKELMAEYQPLLQIAEDWGQRQGSPITLVVHAVVSQTPVSIETLKADTLAYLEWILAAFPHVFIALENNHPPIHGEVKVGIQREEILGFIHQLPSERVGICWDMGHDYLRHQADVPSMDWYSHVAHVHLHDVDQADLDHYPLVLGNVPYHAWLHGLKKANMKGTIVLELKGERLKGWTTEQITEALLNSIRSIASEVL